MTGARETEPPEGPSARPASTVASPTCPHCGGRKVLDPIRLEESCDTCGLVFEGIELIATPPSGPSEGARDGSGRGVGPYAPAGQRRRALGSTLAGTRDGQGRRLDWHTRYEFQHLRRVMQRQTARGSDGALDRSRARSEIEVIGQRLGLPAIVIAEAERIFRIGKEAGLFRGRNLPSTVGATLYAACRRYAIPRTLGEITRGAEARRSEVGRVVKLLRRAGAVRIPPVAAKSFLTRYAEELALSHTVRSNVEAMLEEVDARPEISGISPHGLVAALIYLASERCGERKSRASVARVTALTEVTLRSTSHLLESILRPGDRGRTP